MNGQFARRSVICFALLTLVAASPAIAGETLRMVYFDAFAPYSFMEDGKMRGILPDALTEACRRLNIPLENMGYSWERAQNMVKCGHADGFVTVPTAERKTYALTGEELIVAQAASFFTWAGNPNMERLRRAKSLRDLLGLKVLDYYGDGWGAEHLAGLDVQLVPTLDRIFLLLAEKRGDVFVQDSLVGEWAIAELGLQNILLRIPKPVIPAPPSVLCLGKASPFAARLGEFDETFRKMKDDGAMDRIIARYH